MSKRELSPQHDEVRTKKQQVGTISLAGVNCHIHKPLSSAGSIRVVDVLPASKDDLTIACKLREVNLNNLGAQYEAVSYAWGDANDRKPIRCDGQLLEVTVNCWDALYHLRQEDRVRTLWIDAICIDQRCDKEQSVQERNHQIELMGRVYQMASRVLVWLSPRDERWRIPELFDFCETVSNLKDDTAQSTDDDVDLITEDIKTPLRDRAIKLSYSFMLITNSAWFFRMWTLQEIAFASEASLICGHQNLDWKAFWHGYDYVNERTILNGFNYFQVDIRRDANISIQDSPTKTFDIRHLHAIPLLECSRPHDKIYGIWVSLMTEPRSSPAFLETLHRLQSSIQECERSARENEGSETPSVDELRARLYALETDDLLKLITNLLDDPENSEERSVQVYANIGVDYAFIHLDSGYTGRAHLTCLEGDEVWLLAGADIPVVLRRQTEKGLFRVVAPAFIIGAMAGELWPDEGKDEELEDIILV
ncbi:hypothetical protein PG984_007814 [Apiospora sp. TS-2023a]